MKNQKIKVCLAEDHNVVRNGMIRLLSTFERVSKVNEASNGKELIALLIQEIPDAVILDIEMPEMNGVDTAKYLAEHFPDVKILVLTMHTEETLVKRMLEIGVNGFLSKSADPDEVEKALYAIIDFGFYKNEMIENAITRHHQGKPDHESKGRLTARETEVLLLICQEYTVGEISNQLGISEKTFFNHRASILEKTSCRSNVGLLRFSLQKGYYVLH